MLAKRKKKNLILAIGLSTTLFVICLFAGMLYLSPSNYLTLDVNPSIEIRTNRFNQVVSLHPINEDAQQLMAGYELTDRNLETVIKNIVDRMILNGYLSSNQDNEIMITTDDKNATLELSGDVSGIITEYLKEKQLAGETILQTVNATDEEIQAAYAYNSSVGKLRLVNKLLENDSTLKSEDLTGMRISDLIAFAALRGIFLTDGTIAVNSLSNAEAASAEAGQGYEAAAYDSQDGEEADDQEDMNEIEAADDQGEDEDANDQGDMEDADENDNQEELKAAAKAREVSKDNLAYKNDDQGEEEHTYKNGDQGEEEDSDWKDEDAADNDDQDDRQDVKSSYNNGNEDQEYYSKSDNEDQNEDQDLEESHDEEDKEASLSKWGQGEDSHDSASDQEDEGEDD